MIFSDVFSFDIDPYHMKYPLSLVSYFLQVAPVMEYFLYMYQTVSNC